MMQRIKLGSICRQVVNEPLTRNWKYQSTQTSGT